MEQAINTAFNGWTNEPCALPLDRFYMLLNDCLMPRFRVFRPIGPDIHVAVQRLLELTEHQAQVFEGLYAQDRVLVEGVAGSGKTFLALQRALSFARCGKRTLFVCYNKELAIWIRRQIADDPSTAAFSTLLTVRHFHALAAELADEAEIPFKPAQGGPPNEAFWDDEVPDLLEQAVLALEFTSKDVRHDALVVDEAQDFSLGWWYALTQSLLENSDSPIYAFMDPNQSLRGAVQWPPVRFDARFRLTVNCRNTRKIAVTSASMLNLQPQFFSKAPIGVHPRILRCGNARQQKGLVLGELRRLLEHECLAPSQIVLIGPSAKANGSMADVEEVSGVAFVTSAEAWRDGKGVLITTARSFKGLEADVVILYDLDDFGRLFRKEDLYVACTRARVLLISIVHGLRVRAVLEAALAVAEAQS
jgi:superfamily I DNA/RNA helicase